MLVVAASVAGAHTRSVDRDHRWPARGPWMFALTKELPQLSREFNGIDFGHAHLAETLLETQNPGRAEKARLEILDFIFSSPPVPPDEPVVAPTFTRMVWELQKTFNWTHELHRSLYDLFSAGGRVPDKENAYRIILADYLSKPEAITPHMLDHTGKLWRFPESKAFRDRYPKFNTQIWAYHWLQGGAYDVQLMGEPPRQRELFPRIIAHYHGYLRQPPIQWQFMPMLSESAPEFARRFPEATNIFDNLHMLHDNVDDVLCRPDLYPTIEAKRARILALREIYLHRNHLAGRYHDYHMPGAGGHGGQSSQGGHGGHGGGNAAGGHGGHSGHSMAAWGPRPPSAKMVLEGHTGDVMPRPQPGGAHGQEHGGHAGNDAGGRRPTRRSSGQKGSKTSGQSQPQSGGAAHGGHHE